MSESYVYNIDSNQDRDILNQGSIPHIRQYFDKLEKLNYPQSILNKSTINESPSLYSINSTSFFIKFIAFILLLFIFWDFIHAHNST